MPKVSVIVPVYNAEAFLPKCLSSILAQTVREFELIIIDGGSTDSSVMIVDEYAARDDRVQVVHQPNSSLADARNLGVALARGEDITFVDADDWIESSYLAYLYQIRKETGCQLATCNHTVEVGQISYPHFPKQEAFEALDLRTVFERILYHKAPDVCAWGKLYPSELLHTIRYPAGKISEDVAVIADILIAAGGIGIGFTPQYHYRYYVSSMSKMVMCKHLWDAMDAVERLTQKVIELDPSLTRACVRRNVHAALSAKRLIVQDQTRPDYTRANRVIREGALTVLRDPYAPGRDKLGIVASVFGNKAYRALWQFYCRVRKAY